jgi:hypothetical protein
MGGDDAAIGYLLVAALIPVFVAAPILPVMGGALHSGDPCVEKSGRPIARLTVGRSAVNAIGHFECG